MSLSLTAIYPETKSEGLSSDDMCFQLTHNTSTSEAAARQFGWGAATPPLAPVKIGGKEELQRNGAEGFHVVGMSEHRSREARLT